MGGVLEQLSRPELAPAPVAIRIPELPSRLAAIFGFACAFVVLPIAMFEFPRRILMRGSVYDSGLAAIGADLAMLSLTIVVVKIWERRRLDSAGLREFDIPDVLLGVGGFVALCAVSLITAEIARASGMRFVFASPAVPHLRFASPAALSILSFPGAIAFVLALIAPFTIELMVRGYAIERLAAITRNVGIAAAIAFAAAVVVYLPAFGFTGMMLIAPSQAVLVILYLSRRSIFPGVLAQTMQTVAVVAVGAVIPFSASMFWQAGMVQYRTGQYAQSITSLSIAIRLNPKNENAYLWRAYAFEKHHETANAFRDVDYLLQKSPHEKNFLWSKGWIGFDSGNLPLARRYFNLAIDNGYDDPVQLNFMAWLMATVPDAVGRDGDEAVKFATRACDLTSWKNPSLVDTLAAAYAERGDFQSAIKYQRQAMQLPPQSEKLTADLQKHLDSYIGHKPWREAPPGSG